VVVTVAGLVRLSGAGDALRRAVDGRSPRPTGKRGRLFRAWL